MDTKKTKYVQLVEANFIKSLMENWHKRNHKLLHIGHYSDIEPSYFWDMGFDVTYLVKNQEELERAKEKNGQKIEYCIASPDHLPFDEKIFDFAYCAHAFASFDFTNEQKITIMQELSRVTAQGLCLIEYNTFALSRLRPAISALEYKEYATKVFKEENLELFTALGLPACFWTLKLPLKTINSSPLRIPIGSLMAIRVAFAPVGMTPLLLKVQQAASDISA